ncbi:MAG: LysM peptidoglycan-binding domain-containing protein, partial [Patescibacteria group bacterium]
MKKLLVALMLFMVATIAATAAMGATQKYSGEDLMKSGKMITLQGAKQANPAPGHDDLKWNVCLICHADGDEPLLSDYYTHELEEKCLKCHNTVSWHNNPLIKKADKSKEQANKKHVAKKTDKTKQQQAKKPVSRKMERAVSVTHIPFGESYTVKKGDSLARIAKRFGMHWQVVYALNRDIVGKNPNRIFPNQKLKMPDKGVFHWVNVNADPYGNKDIKKAIYVFDLPEAVKDKAFKAIDKTPGQAGIIYPGQVFRQMWFGKGLANNVLAAFPSPIETRMWMIEHEESLYTFYRPGCTNWSYDVKKIIPVVILEPKKKEIPAIIPERETPEETTPVQEEEMPTSAPDFEGIGEIDGRSFLDIYAGGGSYESSGNNSGSYYWTKVRIKPFDYEFDGIKGNWGIFGTYAAGSGDDNTFGYDWSRSVAGLTASAIGDDKDFDLDVGVGKQFSNGEQDLYKSEQEDDIFLVSAHGNFYARRNRGELWFPKAEVNLEVVLPFDQEHKHSWNGQELTPDPFNNRYAEVMMTQ